MVIECPTLSIVPTTTAWLKQVPDIKSIHFFIFISANAVHYSMQVLKEIASASAQFIAIGEGTAKALAEYGITQPLIPKSADSEHLLELAALRNVSNKIILLFKGEGGEHSLPKF